MVLPDAEIGQVVTRFPPEPNGYLHIGHAKALILNEHFARKYHGRLIVRFDDTNPSLERSEFIDEIIHDIRSLGIEPDDVSYTSDYFGELLSLAQRLIKSGKAYVDDTPQDVLKYERMKGIESRSRNLNITENLRRFQCMCEGEGESELGYVVRAKMNMSDPNKACRDPVLLRSSLVPHHRTGKTFKIYPTYDFACPVVDALEGVTHALRTSEYVDRNPQYKWIQRALGLRNVTLYDYSKLSFVNTVLSKRKLRWLVDNNIVSGWDDPRMPTVKGILRRGLSPEGLRDFVTRMGASRSSVFMEWDKIWSINRQHIDPKAPRFWAIHKKNAVKVILTRVTQNITESLDNVFSEGQEVIKQVPLHKRMKNLTLGNQTVKDIVLSKVMYWDQEDARESFAGEEITLKDWGNVIIKKIQERMDPDGTSTVSEIVVLPHFEGDFKKTKRKIQWLPESSIEDPNFIVTLRIKEYGDLISKRKLEEDDDIQGFVTAPEISHNVSLCYGDRNAKRLSEGMIIQLERWGFYRVDAIHRDHQSTELVLIKIPDGKKK